jgi:NAD(P)-dependent dehydrogenase (short-subunit alcohol dehydrogenase family)
MRPPSDHVLYSRATAAALHAAGCTVAVNYFADAAGHNARLAEESCAALGSRAFPVAADVRNADEVTAMMEEIDGRCGGLDILVNNAAIIWDRTLNKRQPRSCRP